MTTLVVVVLVVRKEQVCSLVVLSLFQLTFHTVSVWECARGRERVVFLPLPASLVLRIFGAVNDGRRDAIDDDSPRNLRGRSFSPPLVAAGVGFTTILVLPSTRVWEEEGGRRRALLGVMILWLRVSGPDCVNSPPLLLLWKGPPHAERSSPFPPATR